MILDDIIAFYASFFHIYIDVNAVNLTNSYIYNIYKENAIKLINSVSFKF